MVDDREIRQERVVGQKAAVRRVDPNDPTDIDNLRKIVDNPAVQQWMDEVDGLTIDDLKTWASKNSLEECLYVISGSRGVELEDVGEIQGFVNIYLSGEIPGAIEVSYAKRPDVRSGQIASGLRQAIVMFNKKFFNDNENVVPTARVIADIDDNNTASTEVARAAGFTKNGDYWELDWNSLNNKLIKSSYLELGIGKD